MNPVPSGDHHPLSLDGDRELTTAYFKGHPPGPEDDLTMRRKFGHRPLLGI